MARRRRRPRLTHSPEVVKDIAIYQRGVILCILVYVLFGISFVSLRQAAVGPPEVVLFGGIAVYLALAVTALVLIFQLASRTYNSVAAGLLALLILVPCLGLIGLLIINIQATSVLQANRVRVGFLGARMSDVQRLFEERDEEGDEYERDEGERDDYEDDRDDDRRGRRWDRGRR
jgi:hypothetical protein